MSLLRPRKITLGDFIGGQVQSFRQGTIMNPFATQGCINSIHDYRIDSMQPALAEAAKSKAVDKWLEKVNRDERREVQFDNSDVAVKVMTGWSRDLRQPVTDIVVADKSNRTGHLHIVIDQYGVEILNEWRDNH